MRYRESIEVFEALKKIIIRETDATPPIPRLLLHVPDSRSVTLIQAVSIADIGTLCLR